MRPSQLLIIAAAAALGLASVACGGTSNGDPTPVQTWKITPASGNATVAPATEAPATATPASGGGGVASTTLTLVGINSTFDPETLEAPAGDIVIEFDNRDAGIPHNVHVFTGDDADGESVGQTDLEAGPVMQTLTMTLEAGDYFYQCDAHPTTMTGDLTVRP